MKKAVLGFVVSFLLMGNLVGISYASDWDVAGKVLTGIAGVRILTGGKVDFIGNIAGINHSEQCGKYCSRNNQHSFKQRSRCDERAWVPNYVWKRKYIPQHKEHSAKYGEIIIESHYIKYKSERGGKWVSVCSR